MSKSLVIVESPTKAKTVNRYLGRDYIVKSSVGHIRDLPISGRARVTTRAVSQREEAPTARQRKRCRIVGKMGIDPYREWSANYQILPGKEKVVDELKRLAGEAKHVYLATDLDREGEAIAWHLREVIGGSENRYRRVVFNEITREAITRAFKRPDKINIHSVNAQQARRFMDRIVGFMVSPLLWKKVARGLSAGRVQSVAVKLLVEREREIKAFVPREFWCLHANTKTVEEECIRLSVTQRRGNVFKPDSSREAQLAAALLEKASYRVCKRTDRPTLSQPPAPFITSTLQQAASTRLGYSIKKTMLLAQRLYEAGYITYIRTDSTNLSAEVVTSVRHYISAHFGKSYLPELPNRYESKRTSQEAHEAIRPSDVSVLKPCSKDVNPDACKLYILIWNQFVACQMTPARYIVSTLGVEADEFFLKAKGRTVKFDGWTRVQCPSGKTEDQKLPATEVGDLLYLNILESQQHFTKPPARYNEAALVKELEKRGIGRPSTYTSIISTIQSRGYVRLDRHRFYAEKIGEIVSDRLDQSFPDLMDYEFTAHMEEKLDKIAEGNTNWRKALDDFFRDFCVELDEAEQEESEGGMRVNHVVLTEIQCPTCSRKMGIRTASTGVFLSCSGYALPSKERCKTTTNLGDVGSKINALEEDVEMVSLRGRKRCPVCNTAMDTYLVDKKRKLHVCGNNPNCEGYETEVGDFRVQGDSPAVQCDKCGHDMVLNYGRFGKYINCTKKSCSNTRKILNNGEIAPPREAPVHFPELPCENKDSYFILRDGASGLFMAASNFPKLRETRAPLVKEFVEYQERIPSKFRYLASAPVQDPDGLPATIRFSRKLKEHYVRTEDSRGRPSGWMANYRDNGWEITDRKRKMTKN